MPATAHLAGDGAAGSLVAQLIAASPEETRALLAAFTSAAFILERSGAGSWHYLAANGPAETMVGLKLADRVGLGNADLFPADIAARLDASYDHCWAGGRFYAYETLTKVGGAPRWLKINLLPLRLAEDRGRIIGTIEDIHEARQAQQQLAERERFLSRAQSLGHMGYWRVDASVQSWSWSPELKQLLGFDPVTFVPTVKALRACFDAAQWRRLRLIFARAIRQHRGRTFEINFIRPDGSVRQLHVEGEPEIDQDGRLTGFFGITQDVTESRRIGRELARSERALIRAQDLGRIGHWFYDVKSRIFETSDALLRLHGLPVGAPVDMELVLSVIPRADRKRLSQLLAMATDQATGFSFQTRAARPDGSMIDISFEAEPELDERGRVARFFGVTQDITDSVRTSTMLREREAALSRALAIGRMGHWHLDVASGAIRWSDEVYELLGLDPRAFTPTSTGLLPLIGADENQRVRALLDEAIAGRQPFDFSTRATRADGTAIDVAVHGDPEFDASGQVVGLFGVVQDISSQKRAERELAAREAVLLRAQRIGRIGHWRLDVASDAIEWSDEIYRLQGYDKANFTPTGARTLAFYPPAKREEIARLRAQAAKRGESYRFEADITRADTGEPLSIAVTGEPEKDASGRVTSIFGITQDITDRRKVERALEQRQQDLMRALRVGRMGHWYADRTTMTLMSPERLADIHGATGVRDRLPLERSIAIYGAADSARLRALVERGWETGEGFVFEGDTLNAKTGQPVALRIVCEPDRDAHGAVVGFFGVTQDVTDRRQIERALEQRERDMSRALKIGRMGHWHYTLATRRIDWSRELFALHGLPEDDRYAALEAANALYDARTIARIEAERAAAIAERRGYFFEADLVRPDTGQIQSIAVHSEPEFGPDGSIIGFFGTTQDITAQKRAERRIVESEARLRVTLQGINAGRIGVSRMDGRRRIIDASPAMLDITGFPTDANISGRTWAELQGEGGTPLGQRTAAIMREIGVYGYWEDMIEWVRPDGGRRHLTLRAVPLSDDVIQVMAFDRTQEIALLNLREQIERNLQSTQKLEALGQLAANLAHEINNQLQPMMTFARAAGGATDDAARAGHLRHVETAARNIRDIVSRTLSFSRPSAQPPRAQPALSLIEAASAFAQPVVPVSMTLERQFVADDAAILVNATEFNQVILNLVRNAVDASRDDGRIVLGFDIAEHIDRPTLPPIPQGRYARIRVTDTGAGMDAAARARLFEPFYTTKTEGKGSGLGLAVVYGIVSRWGGGIAVDSTPGAGTRFDIFIPLCQPA